MKKGPRNLWFGLALSLSSLRCAHRLEAPSAYADQQYLCAEENAAARAALVEQCRDAYIRDKSCAGVGSYRGNIQSVPVVVGTPLDWSQFHTMSDVGGVTSTSVNLEGRSPYFKFEFTFYNVFGMGSDMVVNILPDAGSKKDTTTFIRLESLRANYRSLLESPTYQLQTAASDELVKFSLSTHLNEDGWLDGCFDVFPIDIVAE